MPQLNAAGAGRASEGRAFSPEDAHARDGMSGLDMADPAVLRQILEQAPTPTAVVEGAEHRCTFANAAFRSLGVLPEQQLATRFPAADSAVLNEVLRTGQPKRLHSVGPDQRSWDVDVTPLRGLSVDGSTRALLVSAREAADEQAGAADQQVREISHRVKNTLQLVSSLMTLQALSAKDPAMRRAFQEACGRIGTVTQAHQRIHAVGRGSVVDFSSYLRDACGEMEITLNANGHGRSIVVDADDAMLPVEMVIPLALIVNELVNNAIKHAYAPDGAGDVEVSLRRLPDGGRRLTIADHGRGLPPGFDLARATTLGMKVARAFAGQLRGKLTAESNDPGVRFIVDLPV